MTVVFHHPFGIGGVDRLLPAGSYAIETDEEMIPGLSFLAYRRVRTTMILPIAFGMTTARQVVTIRRIWKRLSRETPDPPLIVMTWLWVQEPVEDGGRSHGVAEHDAPSAGVAVRTDQCCTDAAQPSP